jgi:hypothetical protein
MKRWRLSPLDRPAAISVALFVLLLAFYLLFHPAHAHSAAALDSIDTSARVAS